MSTNGAKLQEKTNKHVEKYTGLFPVYRNLKQKKRGNEISNRMQNLIRQNKCIRRYEAQLEANKKNIKKLPNKQLTEA